MGRGWANKCRTGRIGVAEYVQEMGGGSGWDKGQGMLKAGE